MSIFLDSKKEATAIKKCRGAKNPETAAKVALMKLKMHACGEKSVPQVNHAYGLDKYISE